MTIAALLAAAPELGSPPTIFSHLQSVVQSPASSANDIAKVIATDSGLSARLLKIANSPIYGFPARIESIQTAVTIIGTRQIHDLALATIIIDNFAGMQSACLKIIDFWHHSLAVAIGCHTIAQQLRDPNPERFFLMGILHDIGRLLMVLTKPAEWEPLLTSCVVDGKPLYAGEEQAFGFHHAAVGQEFLASWSIPLDICQAVAGHHSPGNSTDASVILAADACVHGLAIGFNGEARVPPVPESVWTNLGLQPSALRMTVATIDTQHRQLAKILLN